MAGILVAATTAGLAAAALCWLAGSLGWLFGSSVLSGSLAMLMSGVLIFGFGGMSPRVAIFVGLSWAFADKVVAALGGGGTIAHVTMGLAYLVAGITKGQPRIEVVYSGMGPMIGLLISVLIMAVVSPQNVAGGFHEAVLSAAMISAGRAGTDYAALLKARRTGTTEKAGA